MLFFDDCNWEDHCARVNEAYGVFGHRTPKGVRCSKRVGRQIGGANDSSSVPELLYTINMLDAIRKSICIGHICSTKI